MMNRNEDIRRAGMERLAPEQLPAIRLVCKHVGREEGTVSVRDALAWLEGLPEGCEPQSIDWGLLALVQDWSRAMDESLRQDVLPPILPLMPGTRDGGAGAGITALVRPRCLNWWLPGWLMLVSKFSHARSLERLDPASPAMDKLVLRIAGEIPPAEVSMEITRTAYKALHASGMGLAHFDPGGCAARPAASA